VLRRSLRAILLAALPLLLALSAVVAVQVPAHATVTVNDFAGTGTAGYSGDGGAAINAQLNSPQGVAADDVGNVYVFDNQNRRIRKVDGGGTINLLSGDGTTCTSAHLTNQFETDDGEQPALDPGVCSGATSYQPGYGAWLVADSGGIVYFNNGGHLDSLYPSTIRYHIAGKVTGTYSPGDGAAFDVSINPSFAGGGGGALYFAESTASNAYGNSLKRWTWGGGVTTVAGKTGVTTCNYYASDGDLAVGACIYPRFPVQWGNSVYFFDAAPGWRGPVIFRLDLNEYPMRLHKVAGTGAWSDYYSGNHLATTSGISSTGPIAISSTGEIYFGNTNHGVIRKVDTSGHMWDVANVGAAEGGMAFDPTDNLYVSVPSQHKVKKVSGLGSPGIGAGKNLVALGDSVAAGEGIKYGFIWNGSKWVQSGPSNPDWADTTAALGADYEPCHQSEYAYSRLLYAPGYNVYNMACTGASAMGGVLNQYTLDDPDDAPGTGTATVMELGGVCTGCGDPSAIFDGHNPDVVTLTVGANDVHFGDWLTACYGGLTACNTAENGLS
jgi:hypothetical protein